VSFALDTNILLYASNVDSEHHAKARAAVERAASSGEAWVMPWPVVHGFLRIATHPAVLAHPLSPGAALGVMEELLGLPHVRVVGEGPDFWECFSSEVKSLHLRGAVLTDAAIAGLLKTNSVTTFYTHDRDFHRFRGFRVVDPVR
jgi:toxin-antitoxin system PIN domain toxin